MLKGLFEPVFLANRIFGREPVSKISAQIFSIRIVTKMEVFIVTSFEKSASVAQLAEQLFCKQQVVGSSPSAGSF